MKISIKIIKCLLAVMFLISSCSRDKSEAKKIEDKVDTVLTVNTAAAVGRDVQKTVEITGTLAPWDEVIVSNEITGVVDKIFVDLGDKVNEGQLLLKIDQEDAKNNLASDKAVLDTNIRSFERAKAVWTDADLNLKRYTKLFAEGVVSISQKDTAKTQYDIADAQLKQAEAQVNQAKAHLELVKKRFTDTEITAPISGEVKKRFVSKGEVLSDRARLFILVKNDPLRFQGAVSESSVSEINIGQELIIYVDAISDQKFSAKLVRISPSIDEKTRTLSIEALVQNSDNALKSGFFARAVIMTKKGVNVPFIPESAIYAFAGLNKVYVIAGGAAKERLIKIGSREADMIEITEGLKAGEVVAVTNIARLFDGAKVEIQTTDSRPKTKE